MRLCERATNVASVCVQFIRLGITPAQQTKSVTGICRWMKVNFKKGKEKLKCWSSTNIWNAWLLSLKYLRHLTTSEK